MEYKRFLVFKLYSKKQEFFSALLMLFHMQSDYYTIFRYLTVIFGTSCWCDSENIIKRDLICKVAQQ